MFKKFSELQGYIAFGVCALLMLVVQSYALFKVRFPKILEPFNDSEKIYSYLRGELVDIWLTMLIWPAMLAVVLVVSIVRMRRED